MRLYILFWLFGVSFSVAAQTVLDPNSSHEDWGTWEEPPLYTGFIEVSLGNRFQNDDAINASNTLSETRFNLQWENEFNSLILSNEWELLANDVTGNTQIKPRNVNIQADLTSHFGIKAGRQVLTWGVGDYLFLNDFFPKDFQSFFIGREDRYLKSPSDALKISYYQGASVFDMVYTPKFESDIYINGEYLSYFDPVALGQTSDSPVVNTPSGDEWAFRYFIPVGDIDVAFYAYEGFSKSPESLNPDGLPVHHRLRAVGASLVAPSPFGLISAEYAYYDTQRHTQVSQLSPNQSRWLVGLEKALSSSVTGGLQIYRERSLKPAWLRNDSQFESNRWQFTTRLTYRDPRQFWTIQLFNFYSLTDKDGYLRVSVDYSPTDSWSFSMGINQFYGEREHSFFNQFSQGSNGYIRGRWQF